MPNRIKELREARDMTQEALADAARTSFQQISRLENGSRKLTEEWMRRLGDALGVAPCALMSDSLPDSDRVAQQAEEALVLRLWRAMDDSERRVIASIARDKGIEILINDPKKRSA
jgi:transcriptional regulator with XRE-family HTH domain